VVSGLGWIASRYFVERAFSASAKSLGNRIISDVKNAFVHRLEESLWLKPNIILLATEKVHNIKQKVGYPKKVREYC
jgi:endothelin-converting enzyme